MHRIFFFLVFGMVLVKPILADAALTPLQEQFHQLKMQLYAADKKGDKQKMQAIIAQLEVLRSQMK